MCAATNARADLFKFGLQGGDWEAMYPLYSSVLNKRTAEDLSAYSTSLFSTILTSHIEHLKRRARERNEANAHAASANNEHGGGGELGQEESPYAKELQRVGIIELICRKLAQSRDNPEELSVDDGLLTQWHQEQRGTGTWSPGLDRLLLEGVLKHGYGNWKALHGDAVSFDNIWNEAVHDCMDG